MSCVAASSAGNPRPRLSCTIILKPPAVPMPRTGGGEMVMMKASWIRASRLRRSARMRSALSPLATRSWNGASGEKIAPAFGALVKVAPSNPANGTACATPGVSRRILAARRTTASVRASEAPGGSWITVIR